MSTALEVLRSVASRFQLELLPPEFVVAQAAELVQGLPDNRDLAELAGTTPLRDFVGDALARALESEGMHFPTPEDAGRLVAHEAAEAIVRGDTSPVEGARLIWWDVVRAVPQLDEELGHFIGLASEWEDDSSHRNEIEDDIRRAAAELVEARRN